MKTKFSRILVAILILTLAFTVLAACGTNDEFDGMCKVTFNFNGGALRIIGQVQGEIYHLYEPGSLVIDVSKYPSYELTKNDHVFVGWFTKDGTNDDDWGREWNFENDRVTEDMTLYAKWEEEIVYSYTLYYVDEDGEEQPFATYNRVEAGAKFEDSRNYVTSALSNKGRTYIKVDDVGFYKDKYFSIPWDFDEGHPGGDADKDVPVYVKSIPGVWTFVSTYDELVNAKGKNIWLLNDIDCEGKELNFSNSNNDFNNSLYGGGGSGLEKEAPAQGDYYTISNFTVTNSGDKRYPYYTIFRNLGKDAKIEKVNFTDAKFVITVDSTTQTLVVAALAASADKGCVVSDVSVTGTYQYDLTPLLSNAARYAQAQQAIANINNVSFTDIDNIKLSNFTAELTEVTKQD